MTSPRAQTEHSKTAVELLVGFARVGHDAGYPTADLEERIGALAIALGFENTQVSSTPTIVDVSLGVVPDQRSFTLRVRPTSVDLDAIARLDILVQDVLDGRTGPDAALVRLSEVDGRPLDRRWPVRLGASAPTMRPVAPLARTSCQPPPSTGATAAPASA